MRSLCSLVEQNRSCFCEVADQECHLKCTTALRQENLLSNKSAQDRQRCRPSVDKEAKESKQATRGNTLSTLHARCTLAQV